MENISIFLEKFSKLPVRVKEITDPSLREALDGIKMRDLLISFDCEFYTIKDLKNKFISHSSVLYENNAHFVREIGIMFFFYDYGSNKWWFWGNVHLNFPSPTNFGIPEKIIRYEVGKFSNVSLETAKLMQKNDEYFLTDSFIETHVTKFDKQHKIPYLKKNREKILFEIYKDDLPKSLKKIVDDQYKLYHEDRNVKDRSLSVSDTVEFLDLFHELQMKATLLIKGRNDLDAICNNMTLINKKCELSKAHYYDIEIFNSLSRRFFGSAKLYDTFVGFTESSQYLEVKDSLESLLSEKNLNAHNPLFDAYITLVVAVVINLKLIQSQF